jgi:hypothetical protein
MAIGIYSGNYAMYGYPVKYFKYDLPDGAVAKEFFPSFLLPTSPRKHLTRP